MKTSCNNSYSDFTEHVVTVLCDLLQCNIDESADLDAILAWIDSYELSQVHNREFNVRIITDEIHSCSHLLDLLNILFWKKILKR